MIGATFYIMRCSAKNRVLRRLQRLREPRYLVGAIVGTAYLGFAIFGRMLGRASAARRGRQMPTALLPPAFAALGPAIGGFALMVLAVGTWLLPSATGLLSFSSAEKEMLFTAPLTRRQLLLYRLIRSQWSVLFGAVIFAIAYPSATSGARIRGLATVWLALMACNLFMTGVTLTRARATIAGAARRLVLLPQSLTFLAFLVVAAGLLTAVRRAPIETARQAFDMFAAAVGSGAARVALFPFAALVRPLFAESLTAFIPQYAVAVLIYAVLVGWVLQLDAGLDVVSETTGDRIDTPRPFRKPTYRERAPAWTLALQGRPEGAFVWKAAQQTFRRVDRGLIIRLALLLAWGMFVVTIIGRTRGIAQALAGFAAFAAVFATVMGPQIVRSDLRQDLANLDVLQTWPVRPAAVVRGEILWPAIVVTAVAWFLGVIALSMSASLFSRTGLQLRMAFGIAALILAPALVLSQCTIHNATALLFPGWIPADGQRPRGVDALGQRLILLGATWLVLIISLLPGAIAGGILWLAFRRFIGAWILIPSALVATLFVLVEVLMATEALGPAYESLDISSVERIE